MENNPEGYIVVKTACPNGTIGKKMAVKLIEDKLVSSVQMTPTFSFYTWEGEFVQRDEVILSCYALKENYRLIEELICSMHSYEVPQVTAEPIVGISAPFASWINCTAQNSRISI